MKILLVGVNSKYIHSNPSVYYLKSYAIHKAADRQRVENSLEIAEYTINQDKGEILRDIYMRKPDVIAFSCYLWNISHIYSLITALGDIMPDADIWLGGPEVSFDAKAQLLKYPMVRGIIAGEGERSFLRLVQAYLGLSAETRDTLPPVLEAEDMPFDEVPFPYEDLDQFKNRIIYYETSRGCPFGCAYCLSSVDTKVRLRSIDLVREELGKFIEAKVPQVKFVDRTFNCNPTHTLEILEFIRQNDNGVTNFHFEMAAELITEEEMQVLAQLRPGAVQIEVGIQTTNCDTLKAIRRKADMEHLSQIVRRLLSFRNMHVHVDLIAGLPYEDLASFRRSFNEVYALHANELQLGFLKVLKGSPMELETAAYGIKYNQEPPYEVLCTKWLSFGDIIELKGVEEMVEVYYNSWQFTNSMKYLEGTCKMDDDYLDAYALYHSLAEFYAKNGYDKIGLSRLDRYRVLREFVEVNVPEQLEEFTEILLHDLYLRDNVKNRPAYGEATAIGKQEYHAFFEAERYKDVLTGYEGYTSVQISKMVHLEKRKNGYMLYDYKKRSPLTGNATYYWIEGGI